MSSHRLCSPRTARSAAPIPAAAAPAGPPPAIAPSQLRRGRIRVDNIDGTACGYISRETSDEGAYSVTLNAAASLQVRFVPNENGLAHAEILACLAPFFFISDI